MASTALTLLLLLSLMSAYVGRAKTFQMVQVKEESLYEWKKSDVKFSFAKHFQSHMVLQQAPRRANIYGFSPDIGAEVEVTVRLSGGLVEHISTTVESGSSPDIGVWNVILKARKPQNPVNITATSRNVSLEITDVLFGDVYICSGQSNMEFSVARMGPFGAAQVLANAHKYPDIRFMDVYRQESTKPLDDLIGLSIKWSKPTAKTLAPFSAVCWLYAKTIYEHLGYPIGLIGSNVGGTAVEAWSSPEALASCGLYGNEKRTLLMEREHHWEPIEKATVHGPDSYSVLWNSMVHPLINTTIFGVLWYQGEEDSKTPAMMDRYNCTFPALISDWRRKFHRGTGGETDVIFPFGFVQLATSEPPANPNYTWIRWHQTADRGYVPNERMERVFMAVALDLPDFDSPSGPVHTRHKLPVGKRLSLAGLAVAYNQTVEFQGPFPVSATLTENSLDIYYGKTWKLDVRNPEGFEVLCSSGHQIHSKNTWWLHTSILGYTENQISLFFPICGQGEHILGLRYAWKTTPCALLSCPVYSTTNQLPAPPFIVYFSSPLDLENSFYQF